MKTQINQIKSIFSNYDVETRLEDGIATLWVTYPSFGENSGLVIEFSEDHWYLEEVEDIEEGSNSMLPCGDDLLSFEQLVDLCNYYIQK